MNRAAKWAIGIGAGVVAIIVAWFIVMAGTFGGGHWY